MRNVAAMMALVICAGRLIGQEGAEISNGDEASHRRSGDHFIRADKPRFFEGVGLRVSVDTTGAVTHAEVTDGPSEFHEAAVALAKTWTYKPFERDGRAVAVTFATLVSLLPRESAPCSHVAFPEVHDLKRVVITLRRTRCFGTCPAYDLQIDGSGNVIFNGSYPVTGERRGLVSHSAFEGLVERFRKSNYFSLCPSYVLGATDLPTAITSISIDGKSMSVSDYGGLQMGMPASVREIEKAIDEVAGTKRWLKR